MRIHGYTILGHRPSPSPVAETVSEPDNDEAVVYEDSFVAVLRMPLHLALADILLHF